MTRYEITQVLPHRAPMILIDELARYDTQSAVCTVTISAQSPFFDANLGGVPNYIGCEYMAQAIAAYAGANALDKGEAVKIGFLLGSRKYRSHAAQFNDGASLEVSVSKLIEDESGLSVFQCEISASGTCLAEAKINVFQPQDAVQFIRENA